MGTIFRKKSIIFVDILKNKFVHFFYGFVGEIKFIGLEEEFYVVRNSKVELQLTATITYTRIKCH